MHMLYNFNASITMDVPIATHWCSCMEFIHPLDFYFHLPLARQYALSHLHTIPGALQRFTSPSPHANPYFYIHPSCSLHSPRACACAF
ncbi:hypothetical protein M405DRAFT_444444 [Rhizopogon salebrosus TDB-379]|nr:hypothetical protein M405DRAFT_444444 [Rhizopogon salebrosus TDB-379]